MLYTLIYHTLCSIHRYHRDQLTNIKVYHILPHTHNLMFNVYYCYYISKKLQRYVHDIIDQYKIYNNPTKPPTKESVC